MHESKVILLCGSNIAIPVLRDLAFHNQLAAIVIPRHCTAFIQEVQTLLKTTTIPLVLVTKNDLTVTVKTAVQQYQPALGIVFTFTYKIPEEVYTLPARGFLNIHPGPLPGYRGPDPIFQQIKNREPYAGITIHQLDNSFDSGPIVLTDKIRLLVTDTYGMMVKKLGETATRMVATLMKMVGFGVDLPRRLQDDTKAVYYPKQAAATIAINWQLMDAAAIMALVNACNPWNKGAVTMLNNNIIRLLQVSVDESSSTANYLPGTIIALNDNGLKVATVAQCIIIHLIYCEEGFLLASRLKGFGVLPGNCFTAIPV